MANRSRSESPMLPPQGRSESPQMMGDAAYDGYSVGSMRSEFPLYQATIARKRAEQDSILLANRIRMLRKEEEMTRRKIADTEKKTKDIVQLRQRNEERRMAKEMEDARREAEEQALRERQLREKAELQQKLQVKQRAIADEKVVKGAATRQEREVHMQAIQAEAAVAQQQVYARAEKVRREMQKAGRSRARSEGAKQENARSLAYERFEREDEMRRARVAEIERMEREEAQLIARLAQSQERHRAAYLQLEDALSHQKGGGAGTSTPSSVGRCNTPKAVEDLYGPGAAARAAANADIACRAALGSARNTAAKPPRPRGPPYALGAGAPSSKSPVGAAPKGRSEQASRGLGALSSCSTASGDGGSRGNLSSAVSTPTGSSPAAAPAAAAEPIKYTTVDGTTLEIPEEEDLDLASLLCS